MAKILVIDDEKEICLLLQKILEKDGHQVLILIDPVKGLEIVRKEKPDCVLLDLKMPNMDGIETLDAIKKIDKNVGVIMITGHGDVENAMESMKLGAYDYIAKPFDVDFILSLTKRYLKSKKAA